MALTRKQRKVALISLSLLFVVLICILSLSYKTMQTDEIKHKKHKAAVVANGRECADIGESILSEGGSAADAAIATLFCEGVTCPQSMGLGGGFLLVAYNKRDDKVEFLNARETAPAASTEDMFVNKPEAAKSGGLSIAVPGELKGYWELYQRYGQLAWAKLVEPTIKLCKEGHVVTPYLARIFQRSEAAIKAVPSLSEIYINPKTNQTYKEGDKIKRQKLAETLEIIAKEGADALYSKNGSLMDNFVNDIKSFGGIVTGDDMINYSVQWEDVEGTKFFNKKYTIFGSPLPGSGPLINFILRIIDHLKIDGSVISWGHIVEAFKFAYAERTKLADPLFAEGIDQVLSNLNDETYITQIVQKIMSNKTSNDYHYYGANFSQLEDHGTAHVSVLAENGDAIAVTSTINYLLGAMLRSPSTGIILNDEMDDFSNPGHKNAYGIPASPANFIKPGKRPLSSMTPSIVLDENDDVRVILGAAGGSKITLSLVNVLLQHLYFNMSLADAVNARRIYHLLAPMTVQYERGFDKTILDGLVGMGHVLEENPPEFGFTAITAISREKDGVFAVFDPRRGGSFALL